MITEADGGAALKIVEMMMMVMTTNVTFLRETGKVTFSCYRFQLLPHFTGKFFAKSIKQNLKATF